MKDNFDNKTFDKGFQSLNCFSMNVVKNKNAPFNNFQPIVLLQWPCCLCSMFMVLMCLNFATRCSILSTIINLIHIGYNKWYYTYILKYAIWNTYIFSLCPNFQSVYLFAMYNSFMQILTSVFMTTIKILHKCTFFSLIKILHTQNCACMYVLCCKSVHRKESFYSICKQSQWIFIKFCDGLLMEHC